MDREEGVTGIVGFGFALRYEIPALDAISCSVPVARLTPAHEARIVAVMREVGQGGGIDSGRGRLGRLALANAGTQTPLPQTGV
ncbi:hypothetical protein SVIOM74S_08139 [Streptomyces violarus]